MDGTTKLRTPLVLQVEAWQIHIQGDVATVTQDSFTPACMTKSPLDAGFPGAQSVCPRLNACTQPASQTFDLGLKVTASAFWALKLVGGRLGDFLDSIIVLAK